MITANAPFTHLTNLSALSHNYRPLLTLTYGDKASPFIAQAINIPLSLFLAQLNN
jgi:hypothetical protein